MVACEREAEKAAEKKEAGKGNFNVCISVEKCVAWGVCGRLTNRDAGRRQIEFERIHTRGVWQKARM